MFAIFYILVVTISIVSTEIIIPKADYREYHTYLLENGLKVISVYHPKTTQAAFSIGVNAGSVYDPKEIPGLAHFLEHMLFLGTKKYPNPESYDIFMSENGGLNNAYTEDDQTVFFNQVDEEAFEEGLDRFSQFFKEPMFSTNLANREVNAIDAEHKKNVPVDNDRVWYTIRSTANGPMANFSTGNIETLQSNPNKNGIKIIDELKKFYKNHYCASNMVLVTMSSRSLLEQDELINKYFTGVSKNNGNWLHGPCPNNNLDRQPPFNESNTGKFIHIQGNGSPSLWIAFPFKPLINFFKNQPMMYFSYLFEYTGDGSLSTVLQNKGWIENLEVVVDKNNLSSLFGLKVTLTKEGVKNKNSVIEEVFSYINMLRSNGLSNDLLTSLQKQSEIEFNITQPNGSIMNDVSQIASNFLKYDADHVLSGNSLIYSPNEKLIKELLAEMIPSNSIIAFSDSSFPKNLTNLKVDKYYGVVYQITDIPLKIQNKLLNILPSISFLKVPPSLMYIPSETQLEVKDISSGNLPQLVKKDVGYEIWWKGTGNFKIPKISINMTGRISRDLLDLTSTSHALLFSNTITEELKNKTIDMQNCGMQYSFLFGPEGFRISFSAYSSDQLRQIMTLFAQSFNKNKLDVSIFNRVKQSIIDSLRDNESQLAYQHAMEIADVISTSNVYSREDLLQELSSDNSDIQKVENTSNNLKFIYINALSMGNITKEESLNLLKEFVNLSGFKPLKKYEAAENHTVSFKAPVETFVKNPIKKDLDNVTLVEYQLGVPSISDRVHLAMIGQMLNRHMYDKLRTEQQLGYIVAVNTGMSGAIEKLSCIVQGTSKTPDIVEGYIDDELKQFGKVLKNMSMKEFKKWKSSIKSQISAPPVNYFEEFSFLWEPIDNRGYCFDKKILQLEYIENILKTPQQILETYEKLLQPQHRLSVKMFSNPYEIPNTFNKKSSQSVLQPSAVAFSRILKQGKLQIIYNLVDWSNKVVSQFQNFMGFWPYETICELPNLNNQ